MKRQSFVRPKAKPLDILAEIPQQHGAIVAGGREGRGVRGKVEAVHLTLTGRVGRDRLECRGIEQANLTVRTSRRDKFSIGGEPHKVERSIRTKNFSRRNAGLARQKAPFKAPEVGFSILGDMSSEEFTHASHVVSLPGLTGETQVSHVQKLTRMLRAVSGAVAFLVRLTKCGFLALQQSVCIGQPIISQRSGLRRLDRLPYAHCGSDDDRHAHQDRGREQRLVALRELPEAIEERGRTRLNRLTPQVALDVGRQGAGGFVAPVPIFIQRLHHDPVELSPNRIAQPSLIDLAAIGGREVGLSTDGRDPRTGARGLLLANHLAHAVETGLVQLRLVDWRRAGNQFVEQHPQRIHIAAGIDIHGTQRHLLGTHVGRRAEQLGIAGEQRLVGQRLLERLGDAEVDHLDDGAAILFRHEHVGGLQVTVDDCLLMRMLDRSTEIDKQRQTVLDGQAGFVTVLGDGDPFHQLHH